MSLAAGNAGPIAEMDRLVPRTQDSSWIFLDLILEGQQCEFVGGCFVLSKNWKCLEAMDEEENDGEE